MTDRAVKYGFFFSCSMIFFTVVFTILFAGFSGAFSSSGTGTVYNAVLSALPGGLAIALIVTIFGLMWFVCQEEG